MKIFRSLLLASSFLFALLFLSVNCAAQSPTYQALVAINYSSTNSSLDVKTVPTLEDFNSKKNKVWGNIYFKYFKNSNFTIVDEDPFKFTATNELAYLVYCGTQEPLTLSFKKSEQNKSFNLDIVMFSVENGKVISEKIKGKNYTVIKEPSQVKLEINKDAMKPGAYLRIISTVEASNLKQIGIFSFAKPVTGDYEFMVTANIPSAFEYEIPSQLQFKEQTTKEIRLKRIVPSSPPIIDYNMVSNLSKWTLPSNINDEISFNLKNIFFPFDVGVKAQRIMEAK